MGRKLTGKPNGRPPTRQKPNLYEIVIGQNGEPRAFRPNVPLWWIALAHVDAEIIVPGPWQGLWKKGGNTRRRDALPKHPCFWAPGKGQFEALARYFTGTNGRPKSKSAITKVRNDPRYRAYRDMAVAALQNIRAFDALNPDAAKSYRKDLRADITAAFEVHELK